MTASAAAFQLCQKLLQTARLPVFFTLLLMAGNALAFSVGNNSLFGSSDNGFLPVDEALPFSYSTDKGAVILNWNVAPEHYLYRGRIKITPVTEGVTTKPANFSLEGENIEDEYFGAVTVFYNPIEARIPITLPPGINEAHLKVTYQGCANAGLCYPPQTRDVLYYPGSAASLDIPGDAKSAPPTPDSSGISSGSQTSTSSATGLAGFLSQQSIWMIAGVFLLLGLGLTFTPCVLPMVPIISSLVSSNNTRTTGHALLLSVSYVLGMAITYAMAGVITGLLGASFNLQAQLQSPWVLGIFATLFVLFALSMFDLFEIQLPRFARDRLNNASQRLTGARMASVFGIGALSALIVSPCVSAPLAGSLLYISTTQDAVIGGVALLALGLGMGVPLILVAVGGRKLLPSAGHWMTSVKYFYGVMLLAVAIWLVERLVPGWAGLTLWGLLIAITGVQLGAFDAARAGWERTRKGLGLVFFAYGLALLAGAVTGANDPLKPLAAFTPAPGILASSLTSTHADFQRVESPDEIRSLLAQAKSKNQPVMLDFYADWCISCKIMERNVFSDPLIVQALSPYTLLQIDLTDNTPEQQALLNELGLFGPPAILFYHTNGQELEKQRILGEMNKDEFMNHLKGLTSEA